MVLVFADRLLTVPADVFAIDLERVLRVYPLNSLSPESDEMRTVVNVPIVVPILLSTVLTATLVVFARLTFAHFRIEVTVRVAVDFLLNV